MNMSLIICTHNNAGMLHGALEAAALQTASNGNRYEIIVVDNGSTDGTRDVVNRFIGTNRTGNIKYVFEPQVGLASARLAGLGDAAYDVLAFADDDIRLDRRWCHEALDFFEKHPGAGVAGGKIRLSYQQPPTEVALKCEDALCAIDCGDSAMRAGSWEAGAIAGAAIAFRRKAIEDSGWLKYRFFEGRKGRALSSGEDSEIFIRIRNSGWETWYDPAMRAVHMIPPHRMSLSYMCRLHWGLASTSAFLRAIASEWKVPISLQVRHLFRDVLFTVKRLAAWLGKDMLRSHKLGDKRLVQICEGLGRVKSCLSYMVFSSIGLSKTLNTSNKK